MPTDLVNIARPAASPQTQHLKGDQSQGSLAFLCHHVNRGRNFHLAVDNNGRWFGGDEGTDRNSRAREDLLLGLAFEHASDESLADLILAVLRNGVFRNHRLHQRVAALEHELSELRPLRPVAAKRLRDQPTPTSILSRESDHHAKLPCARRVPTTTGDDNHDDGQADDTGEAENQERSLRKRRRTEPTKEQTCTLCSQKPFATKHALNEHILTMHTGSSAPKVIESNHGSSIHAYSTRLLETWSLGIQESARENKPGSTLTLDEKEYISILLSCPRAIRYTGGYIESNNGLQCHVSGNKTVFKKSGNLKDCYRFLKKKDEHSTEKPERQELPRLRSRRNRQPIRLPRPFINKSKLQALNPSSFTEVSANMYCASFFIGTVRPEGLPAVWEWPQDPTWISPLEPQCDLCNERACVASTK
ncbi:hypothetical protein IFR05_015698 [Cadophora sp. M221]|nr:hypothetical protein IFR05_015698 [Cadophora sp. M221]